MDKKYFIYKNDLKFNDDFDIQNSEFDTGDTADMYANYKKQPKIELRIKDSEMEGHEYLDLSKLNLTTELLIQLFTVDKIKQILKKICFLDLSNNDLKSKPDLSPYPNIIYLNVAYNNISGSITDNNIIELSCEYNKIASIESNSLTKISASNNLISRINTPKIKVLIISNNKLQAIGEYENLEYLECIDNKITAISNCNKLQEIYISNNQLESISGMDKLSILNCTKNPIKKINYLRNVKLIICSTPNISTKYSINNITKIKQDYLLDIKIN